MRRLSALAIAVLATAACDDTTTAPAVGPETTTAAASRAATGPAAAASYRVTVHNLSSGQPFTPPLAAVHRTAISLFEVGAAASVEIQEIAENGNLAPMIAFASAAKHVKDAVVTEGPTLPPLLPGESVSFDVDGRTGAKYLSVVSMLICTNDGFTGVNSMRLPRRVGETASVDAYGYDAGTEVNTEAWSDLVPPCAPLTGFDAMGAGTGMSDPTLAEDGVIRMHPGITGDADLDPTVHGWTGAVARYEVERIG
ncbi:MAG: spondin domain-containing protein [Gemmatimonadetes bacterium]|nr:spondin domain-containing protein [Gemmatimonadota bacterium]MBT8404517.1 spondin domain-containing protein [Gemmatimonadota bacterium]NNF38885.1 hypothetical protein [Gemmatimonadota bacterium]NNK63871.1 hypothetical protein [Gemmatimonadota bacterium]